MLHVKRKMNRSGDLLSIRSGVRVPPGSPSKNRQKQPEINKTQIQLPSNLANSNVALFCGILRSAARCCRREFVGASGGVV